MHFASTVLLQHIHVRIHNKDFPSAVETTISWPKSINYFLPYWDFKYIFVIMSIHSKCWCSCTVV